MNNIDKNIITIIDEIKKDILNTRNKILTNANKELIAMYFRIGKYISENSKYGNSLIDTLSITLKTEFPGATGYSPRNLARMRRFYEEYKDLSNLPTALAKLPWSFNNLLIDKVNDVKKREWYAFKCFENSWSYVVLDHQIDLELYERQALNNNKLTNFNNTLPQIQGELANDIMKDPYVFELTGLKEKVIEKNIENAMLERIKSILLEFGKGFSFVGNQYRVSTENKDYIIDLLFYHLELRCYVVVELKNDEFDPSYIGQLLFYVTAIDETLKKDYDNKTIGLLLCKGKDKLSVEWALKSVNVPVGVASFKARQYLPSEEEINILLSEDNK